VTQLLLLGGRSGVGKNSVAFEVSARLRARGVAHCVIDGDHLGFAFPKPADDPHGTRLTQSNLSAVWRTYAALGHRRLIYLNTVCVIPEEQELIATTIEASEVTSVLLTADDETVAERLGRREGGSELAGHLERNASAASRLERDCSAGVIRIDATRPLSAIAEAVLELLHW
jgi:predicted kinase